MEKKTLEQIHYIWSFSIFLSSKVTIVLEEDKAIIKSIKSRWPPHMYKLIDTCQG